MSLGVLRDMLRSKLFVKHFRNTAMIPKLEQMADMADSSAHGKANPCGHPSCIFVRTTAGHVGLRLTLPKLHLATFSMRAVSLT